MRARLGERAWPGIREKITMIYGLDGDCANVSAVEPRPAPEML
jgi:hypothetical protein